MPYPLRRRIAKANKTLRVPLGTRTFPGYAWLSLAKPSEALVGAQRWRPTVVECRAAVRPMSFATNHAYPRRFGEFAHCPIGGRHRSRPVLAQIGRAHAANDLGLAKRVLGWYAWVDTWRALSSSVPSCHRRQHVLRSL